VAGLELVHGSAAALPFADASFDAVYTCQVGAPGKGAHTHRIE
jgi:ubiquinone/menaquinone biosynthesis C-methylase UbiE